MAISRPTTAAFSFFLLICSSAFLGYSEGTADPAETMQCIQKLMPCQAFLKGSPAPAESCCVPLKEIMAADGQCLCAVLEDETILKSMNVSKADFLGLAKSCGANSDTSICKPAAAAPTESPSAPSSSNSSNSATATAISNFGGYASLNAAAALLTYFIISAF
ncbi:hypothetical protein Salat_2831000 [Sesamum alatum]|uniref:Bifunctional inhibitor/plant lipid transfer protein/seed storage helical domain-containing protein n=1 Tax=Sesamum alatum TaxID=300844 RepID=A0AAE1XMP6_9LAMI|nr:hypothetical protein Salat_2831000 [Sesamum alatum]